MTQNLPKVSRTAKLTSAALAVGIALGAVGATAVTNPNEIHLQPGQQILVIADPPSSTAPSASGAAKPVTPKPSASPTATPAPTPRVINVASGTRGYVPQANEIIDGWTINCPGDAVFNLGTDGIYINAPNVTVRNVHINGCAGTGIRLDSAATGFLLENNTITHSGYAAIITTGSDNGVIRGNLIQFVGDHGHQTPDCNAYGIVISMWTGGSPSTNVTVQTNTVTDVPLWHAYDTHGGQQIKFLDNIAQRSARAYFFTANAESEVPRDIIATGNQALEAKSAPCGTDKNSAFTWYKSVNGVMDNNKISNTYSVFPLNNISNLSTFLHPPANNVRVSP